MEQNNYYSYRLVWDTTFAPNPHKGILTLATCKPVIRRTARVGDWIAGFAAYSVKNGIRPTHDQERLIYLAKISEIMPLAEYWEKHPEKRPDLSVQNSCMAYGDNIYEPTGIDNELKLISNAYHTDGDVARDLRGKNAIICDDFYYFAQDNRLAVPSDFDSIVYKGRGHTKKPIDKLFEDFIDYVTKEAGKKGIIGEIKFEQLNSKGRNQKK
jgi:hypothetical protein